MTAPAPSDDSTRPLAGVRVVTTRDEPGILDELLAARGADVVHVPLIEIGEPADGGAALRALLARADEFDWLVVTSRQGARRVGVEAAARPGLRLAAVGTGTARELAALAHRQVDLVPDVQLASALVAAFPQPPSRVLVAQADIAAPTLVEGLRAAGHHVEVATAYSTTARHPAPHEVVLALSADALTLASGSAARSWKASIGTRTPPIVCAIGPSTAAVAADEGLKVSAVATDHSVEGLVGILVAAVARAS